MMGNSYTAGSDEDVNFTSLHPEKWTSEHLVQWLYHQAMESRNNIGLSVCPSVRTPVHPSVSQSVCLCNHLK